jgi:hypothetical protein
MGEQFGIQGSGSAPRSRSNPGNSSINRLTILFISAAISPSSRAPVREDIFGCCLVCLFRVYEQLYQACY